MVLSTVDESRFHMVLTPTRPQNRSPTRSRTPVHVPEVGSGALGGNQVITGNVHNSSRVKSTDLAVEFGLYWFREAVIGQCLLDLVVRSSIGICSRILPIACLHVVSIAQAGTSGQENRSDASQQGPVELLGTLPPRLRSNL